MRRWGLVSMVLACLCAMLMGSVAKTPMTAHASDGWLPDAKWGPWERFSDPSGSVYYEPRQVAVDMEGRFVVVGWRVDTSAGTRCPLANPEVRYFDYRLAVARYLPDGRLDTSFADNGVIVLPQFSQGFDYSSLALSGNDIYVSAGPQTGKCGGSDYQPMSEVVLRISEEGVIDRRLGSQGIWETGSENEQPRLESLPGDSVGGVAAGTFMHVSPRGAVTTDVKDLMCPDDPWNCWGMKLATVGPTVAVARVDGGADQEQRLAVLFGDVRERSLVPDTRVGGSGVLNVDLAPMLGSLWATGGSHSPWLAFDGEGRLLVMVTVAEPYGPDEKPPYTHAPYARALITARFVPDPQRGWILDPTYGAAGLDHVDLPMEGADSFVIEAFGVDTRGRPVIAGGWYNFSVDDAGNFVVRLTESGDFDRSYGNDTACIRFAPDGTCSALGSSGITWMPPNSPNIRGRPALDNRDNVYLSGALSAFGSRAKKQAAYRLGRVKPQGLIQVHDGRAWQSTQAQPRPRLLLDVQRGLPSSVTAGRKVWVTARVTLPSLQAGKVAPVKGATVSVMAMRPRGPSDRTPVASARTDARGYVRLRVTVKAKGSFAITAEANGYVGAGSDPVKVAVAPRSQPRSGERWLAHEPVG